MNAGIFLENFDPETATFENKSILGATLGGCNFTATPTFSDMGEDIDNCPKNMKELKKLENWEAAMSGTFVSTNTARAKSLCAAADIDTTDTSKIVPRNELKQDDFKDIWWVGDYSDKNGEKKGGFMAIKLINALSTGGFRIKSGDKAKGQLAFTYTAHYSIENPDEVPFEIYIKAGEEEVTA